jgi:hypothetical protein
MHAWATLESGWWRVRDLNPGPTDYDSAALTAELTRHKEGRSLKSRVGVVKADDGKYVILQDKTACLGSWGEALET